MLTEEARKKNQITKANAVEMARRSWAARKLRQAKMELEAQEYRKAQREAEVSAIAADDYIAGRLTVTRALIARLELQMSRVDDPDAAGKLATALSRMTDVEFALANRPKPAAAKQPTGKARLSRPTLEPLPMAE